MANDLAVIIRKTKGLRPDFCSGTAAGSAAFAWAMIRRIVGCAQGQWSQSCAVEIFWHNFAGPTGLLIRERAGVIFDSTRASLCSADGRGGRLHMSWGLHAGSRFLARLRRARNDKG